MPALDSGSIIQRVQDEGWIRLRRGRVTRTGPVRAWSFCGLAMMMIVAFFGLAAIGLHPFVNFIALVTLMVLAGAGISAVVDLFWGVGARVSISRHPVRPGESLRLRCTLGHAERAQDVSVLWQGREEAVLRGYDTTRFTEPFLRRVLPVQAGSVSIDVPHDAMPTFAGKNMSIVWSIVVEARRASGLTQDDFPVVVLPGPS